MLKTFKCTYVSGDTAVLKDDTFDAACKRFEQMGRGDKVWKVREVGSDAFKIYGNDADEDYEDGE